MFDNTPIQPRPRRRFRVLMIFAPLAVLFIGATVVHPRAVPEFAFVFQTLSAARDNLRSRTGGDIEVPPPVIQAPKLPVQTTTFPLPNLTSAGILVKDHETGARLYGKEEYTKHPIASMTKLMSALVILDHGGLPGDTLMVISDDISDTHMYAGDTYTREELWYAGLVGSSNKAILTLSDATGLTRDQFVAEMNRKARSIGMADSVFTEPTGLDPANLSTASDMAMLARTALDVPLIREALMTKEYDLYSKERSKKHHFWNTNWLLLGWVPHQFEAILGGKTGYIPESGYNVALQIQNDAGKLLDVVILGAATNEARFTDARDIAEWVFTNFTWPDSVPPSEAAITQPETP